MKAVALVSGGLDSSLAARIVAEQSIEVVCLFFRIPFCPAKLQPAEDFACEFSLASGLKTLVVDLTEEFLEIVRRPAFGYGRNMNVCIDCRILMLRKARDVMNGQNASFLVTGEVLGQRPMSQFRNTMEMIEREAGTEGIVLRPLSAKLLKETLPEKNGWIDRSKLHSFSGRSRSPQIDLAVMMNVIDYPQPAGGCLLTDRDFSARLRDLLTKGEYNANGVELLKVGRHFRFSDSVKLIVGRNEHENAVIESLARRGDVLLRPVADTPGPTSLVRAKTSAPAEFIRRAAGVTASYSDAGGNPVEIEVLDDRAVRTGQLSVTPLERDMLNPWRI